MYGFAAERRGLREAIEMSDMRMPLECDEYENINYGTPF
jgi:hypothetical protein